MADRIEQTVELEAAPQRVWRALTDSQQFGAWFGVKLDGPFVEGEVARGHITHPGYEHVVFEAAVVAMDYERRFAFRWPQPKSLEAAASGTPGLRPTAPDGRSPFEASRGLDETAQVYAGEPTTLVEFRLSPRAGGGTRLVMTESGFDALPDDRREENFRRNAGGWEQQARNIAGFLR